MNEVTKTEKTNAEKYEEVFGCKPEHWTGTLYCPPGMADRITCSFGAYCNMCRKWWNEPYIEPKE